MKKVNRFRMQKTGIQADFGRIAVDTKIKDAYNAFCRDLFIL